jgi:hypothetical protein
VARRPNDPSGGSDQRSGRPPLRTR